MTCNILITGAAGYIGGSVVAGLLAQDKTTIKVGNINVSVRSAEQAQSLAKLEVNVLKLDLGDGQAVTEAIVRHEIDIVIHCASSIGPNQAVHLVTALGARQKASGKSVYYVHTSGTSAYAEETGWPHGVVKDGDHLYELEKQMGEGDAFPVRRTSLSVIETAKAHGVTSLLVVPPVVYGRGKGEWNQSTMVLPGVIRGSIKQKAVYKFAKNTRIPVVHISDLVALYVLLLQKILDQEPIPSGEKGYYFAVGHEVFWWEILNDLAIALHADGLVTDPELQIWPSDEQAAESFGVPVGYVRIILDSGAKVIPENAGKLGWKPAWNKERLLRSICDEIQAAQEPIGSKSSLYDTLNRASSRS